LSLIEEIFDTRNEFNSLEVSVTKAFASSVKHINLVPFQVFHIGAYFIMIGAFELNDPGFPVALFPYQHVDFIIDISKSMFPKGPSFESSLPSV
jgi:hypothetical protein